MQVGLRSNSAVSAARSRGIPTDTRFLGEKWEGFGKLILQKDGWVTYIVEDKIDIDSPEGDLIKAWPGWLNEMGGMKGVLIP